MGESKKKKLKRKMMGTIRKDPPKPRKVRVSAPAGQVEEKKKVIPGSWNRAIREVSASPPPPPRDDPKPS